ncbi:MAG: ferredoxin family protein [Alphaproteobacteria bacterium]|nr:ferredoxin family protein [Alphaproteobacteria bacterium]
MAYVITQACIDVKDKACVPSCPVECIYEGGRMLYIHPDECINCGLCVSVCPVQAIYPDDQVPEGQKAYIAANAEFFGDSVTGWHSPGGAGPRYVTDKDHPLVASQPRD